MKTYLLTAITILALSACGNKNKPSQVNSIKFPPPVVMPDEEVAPSFSESSDAEIELKPVKGDPSADIKIDEPVGNADVKAVSEYGYLKPVNREVTDTSKKVTKEGEISFETKDIAATRKKLLNTLQKLGGYFDEDNESINSEDDRKEYTLKSRIPSKNFDVFLNSVSADAIKIDSKHITISDVTARYIDISTRLKNKKLLEAQYLGLLKKANKMSDVLEVENKLNDIRTEIESTQGQLNYLNKQIAYSSLNITFYATHLTTPYATSNTFGHQFSRSLTRGLNTVKKVFFGVIALWPLWVAITAGYFITRKIRRRRKVAPVPTTASA